MSKPFIDPELGEIEMIETDEQTPEEQAEVEKEMQERIIDVEQKGSDSQP